VASVTTRLPWRAWGEFHEPGDELTINDRRYRIVGVRIEPAAQDDPELGVEQGDYVETLALDPVERQA
jgi:hypothetical protein